MKLNLLFVATVRIVVLAPLDPHTPKTLDGNCTSMSRVCKKKAYDSNAIPA